MPPSAGSRSGTSPIGPIPAESIAARSTPMTVAADCISRTRAAICSRSSPVPMGAVVDAPRGAANRGSTPPAIGFYLDIRQPDILRQSSRLPEHIDRNPTAGVPESGDPQIFWLDRRGDTLADFDRAIFVECGNVAITGQEQL